jgi:hypothetical protein
VGARDSGGRRRTRGRERLVGDGVVSDPRELELGVVLDPGELELGGVGGAGGSIGVGWVWGDGAGDRGGERVMGTQAVW